MEMEKSENTANQSLSASLCTSGCGFFGSQKFDGMCSQCYKDALKRQQTPDNSRSRSTTPPSSSSSTTACSSSPTTRRSVETGSTTIRPINTIQSSSADAAAVTTVSVSDTVVDSIKTLIVESSTTSDRTVTASSATASSDEGAVAEPATSKQEAGADIAASPASPSPSEAEKKSKKRNKCGTCKKKVGLTGFECRCGGLFCGLHRYSDKHDCQYDYKKEGEVTIRKNNPLVVGAKVQKI